MREDRRLISISHKLTISCSKNDDCQTYKHVSLYIFFQLLYLDEIIGSDFSDFSVYVFLLLSSYLVSFSITGTMPIAFLKLFSKVLTITANLTYYIQINDHCFVT